MTSRMKIKQKFKEIISFSDLKVGEVFTLVQAMFSIRCIYIKVNIKNISAIDLETGLTLKINDENTEVIRVKLNVEEL